LRILKTTISVIISMLLFILFVKLCMDNREQHAYAIRVLAIYFVIINLYGLLIMYVDKNNSRKAGQGSRVSERQLFIVTALGGFLGTIMGMRLLRHKTRKTYFNLLFPLISIVDVVAIVVVVNLRN
jgi:uncharacterized membrane protein YsdA (DUF1294 family)